MMDFDDGTEGLDDEDARDGLSRKLRTEGARIAYDTAVSICRDPKATSAAKASAVNSLFRAGGFFSNYDLGSGEKDLSEMSPEEVNEALRKTQAALARREAEKSSGGLFG
ncbi:MAG: hypothetical protein WBB98_17715 [Xanthobacteraceae bacterium]